MCNEAQRTLVMQMERTAHVHVLTMLCWYGTHCDLVSVVFFVIFHLLTVVIVLPTAALLCVC